MFKTQDFILLNEGLVGANFPLLTAINFFVDFRGKFNYKICKG